MTYLRIRKHRQDAVILVNQAALAEFPVGVVKEALDVTHRKMVQDGKGNLYIVKKQEAA